MIDELLTVFLTAIKILTTVIFLAYIYCKFGEYQERKKYKKFGSETKDRIMRTIVKR
ncbi:MAG: hypothetical protein K0Q53_138 [Massilibacillus sp.]|jgi:hypothetical protein|nr:hypothetical protein [Massilibacillus sp.]